MSDKKKKFEIKKEEESKKSFNLSNATKKESDKKLPNKIEVPEDELRVIKELEAITVVSLPKVDRLMWEVSSKKESKVLKHQLGYIVEKEEKSDIGHIIGIGLCPRRHGSLIDPYFQLNTLPASLQVLKKLRILDLSSNGMTSTWQINQLGQQTNPGLNLLPEWFGNLTSLEELNLSWNKLSSLPESFGNLKSLRILHLYKNNLRTLPASFGSLHNLQNLYLSQNQLTHLPETIGNLKNLQELDLQNNKITSLPGSFGNLLLLQRLSLAQNKIKILPELDQLFYLENFSIRENELKLLHDSFSKLVSLHELDLSYNELTSLPEKFGEIIVLIKLDVRNNKLIKLPKSFALLKSLKSLNFDGNPWNDEFKEILSIDLEDFKIKMKEKAGLYIFIINEREDLEEYKIRDIAEKFENEPEFDQIFKITTCDWMIDDNLANSFIKESHLVLFFATLKSFKSKESRRRLDIAREHELRIIPIKGRDISFENLAVLGLKQEEGVEYRERNSEFDEFCRKLYAKIILKEFEQELKREPELKVSVDNKITDNLSHPNETAILNLNSSSLNSSNLDTDISSRIARVELLAIQIKNRIGDVVNSREFMDFLVQNLDQTEKLQFKGKGKKSIILAEHIVKLFKLFLESTKKGK
ncbi:MAG: leucine-rich repeat domain-containing protein [Promethearchaeota archaeon]